MILNLFEGQGLPTTIEEMSVSLLCMLKPTHSTQFCTQFHIGGGAVKVQQGPYVNDPKCRLIIEMQDDSKK